MALEDTKRLVRELRRKQILSDFVELMEELREFKFEEGPSGIVEELYHVALQRQKGNSSG